MHAFFYTQFQIFIFILKLSLAAPYNDISQKLYKSKH